MPLVTNEDIDEKMTERVVGVAVGGLCSTVGCTRGSCPLRFTRGFFEPANIGSIRRKGVHLGYVPRARNATIAQLFRFGHNNVFECRVMKVDKSADPRNQVHVGIYVIDKRKKN